MTAGKQCETEVRIVFQLDVEDGFPPIGSETLIGYLQDSNIARVDNTPFFVEGIALGDIVSFTGEPPNLYYGDLVEESGNKAISIIFLKQGYEEKLYQLLKSKGCYCEFGEFPGFNMLAVCVHQEQSYEEIQTLLRLAEDDGRISFAELCIS